MPELDDMNVQMDVSNLYTEEVVTDRKVGTIRVLNPITPEGEKDPARKPIYSGADHDAGRGAADRL